MQAELSDMLRGLDEQIGPQVAYSLLPRVMSRPQRGRLSPRAELFLSSCLTVHLCAGRGT